MLNLLSIKTGQFISGKEINDWCRYQIENQGSHFKEACKLISKDFKDECVYRNFYGDGSLIFKKVC